LRARLARAVPRAAHRVHPKWRDDPGAGLAAGRARPPRRRPPPSTPPESVMHIVDLSRLTDRVVGRVLTEQAETAGDATWLMSDDRPVTFGEARDRPSRIAGALRGLGVGRGSVVAFHMDASIELVLTGVGASELGAMYAPMSTDYHGEFLTRNVTASTAE